MTLLDTRFLEYQHACIGTIKTTLNVGTVFVTSFPNFNMALSDPRLLTALKVQLQITGAPQVQDSVAATLHYQMAYQVMISFDRRPVENPEPSAPSMFQTMMMMQPTDEELCDNSQPGGKHCYWDVCDDGDCDVNPRKKRKEPPCSEEAKKDTDPKPYMDVEAGLSTVQKKKVLPRYMPILKWVRK
ncbi:hypothetical protein CRG98_015338 [Punica granatum]|uniref:Uncharacterized protein n=1 Tax=Punica granatum TaxID=22663 RepID=A0A2I0K6U0_PUNGR|nr:hypothetical protein CRG98_015338 [Punica granatum]